MTRYRPDDHSPAPTPPASKRRAARPVTRTAPEPSRVTRIVNRGRRVSSVGQELNNQLRRQFTATLDPTPEPIDSGAASPTRQKVGIGLMVLLLAGITTSATSGVVQALPSSASMASHCLSIRSDWGQRRLSLDEATDHAAKLLATSVDADRDSARVLHNYLAQPENGRLHLHLSDTLATTRESLSQLSYPDCETSGNNPKVTGERALDEISRLQRHLTKASADLEHRISFLTQERSCYRARNAGEVLAGEVSQAHSLVGEVEQRLVTVNDTIARAVAADRAHVAGVPADLVLPREQPQTTTNQTRQLQERLRELTRRLDTRGPSTGSPVISCTTLELARASDEAALASGATARRAVVDIQELDRQTQDLLGQVEALLTEAEASLARREEQGRQVDEQGPEVSDTSGDDQGRWVPPWASRTTSENIRDSAGTISPEGWDQ